MNIYVQLEVELFYMCNMFVAFIIICIFEVLSMGCLIMMPSQPKTQRTWPRVVTMNVRPLKCIRSPYHGQLKIKFYLQSCVFKCSVKTYVTKLSTKCYMFLPKYALEPFQVTWIHNEWRVLRFKSDMVCQFYVRPTSWRLAWLKFNKPRTLSYSWHVGLCVCLPLIQIQLVCCVFKF